MTNEFKDFMKRYFFCLILFIPLLLQTNVEHKSFQIDKYLANISLHLQEKTQLLEHIFASRQGTYVDIGTGGDSLLYMAEELPKNCLCTLIGADIDPLVLEQIVKRKPEIIAYLKNKEGLLLDLKVVDATNMKTFHDSSIEGLGASSLLHEVFSHSPSCKPLDHFVDECCRILKKDGIFVYRDARWVSNPQEMSLMIFKDKLAKIFTTLFLPKFFQKELSKAPSKDLYDLNDIKIFVFLKGNPKIQKLSLKSLYYLPSESIDFDKDFSLSLPLGLAAEIQRHYLVFLKCTFACTDIEKKMRIEKHPEYNSLIELMDKGLIIQSDQTHEITLHLNKLNFNRKLVYYTPNNELFFDPKALLLSYTGNNNELFKLLDRKNISYPKEVFNFFALEGEEYYFYKTLDELITYIGKRSYNKLLGTNKVDYILAPIDTSYIRDLPRENYKKILLNEMDILDAFGKKIIPITSKNVIHFKLQPKEQALKVFTKLIKKDPDQFNDLKEWLEDVR